MTGIADTGFLVALAAERDRHHAWAVQLAARVTESLLTCEAVLAEAAYLLRNSEAVPGMVRDGLLAPVFDLHENLARLAELAHSYRDRDPDLADLCLIRLSELNPRHEVITVDVTDFRIYRRHGREIIPLIHPPER